MKPEEVWLFSTVLGSLECDFGMKKLMKVKRGGKFGVEFSPKRVEQDDIPELSPMVNKKWRLTIEEIK